MNNIRIKLLNDGGYYGFEYVNFPVEVTAEEIDSDGLACVSRTELIRIGAYYKYLDDEAYAFTLGEYEILEEKND